MPLVTKQSQVAMTEEQKKIAESKMRTPEEALHLLQLQASSTLKTLRAAEGQLAEVYRHHGITGESLLQLYVAQALEAVESMHLIATANR